jgi:hypothetical protein
MFLELLWHPTNNPVTASEREEGSLTRTTAFTLALIMLVQF